LGYPHWDETHNPAYRLFLKWDEFVRCLTH
jgi:hypothetical protein